MDYYIDLYYIDGGGYYSKAHLPIITDRGIFRDRFEGQTIQEVIDSIRTRLPTDVSAQVELTTNQRPLFRTVSCSELLTLWNKLTLARPNIEFRLNTNSTQALSN